MAKILIFTGVVIILHTILAMMTGIPEITDCMPIDWFISKPDGAYFMVTESEIPNYLWVYTVLCGCLIASLGLLLLRLKKLQK